MLPAVTSEAFTLARIQFGSIDAARRYTVGGNGAGSNLTGR